MHYIPPSIKRHVYDKFNVHTHPTTHLDVWSCWKFSSFGYFVWISLYTVKYISIFKKLNKSTDSVKCEHRQPCTPWVCCISWHLSYSVIHVHCRCIQCDWYYAFRLLSFINKCILRQRDNNVINIIHSVRPLLIDFFFLRLFLSPFDANGCQNIKIKKKLKLAI